MIGSRYKYWGYCHQVALVLHKLTKAPIVILYGQRDGEDSDDTEEVLIHCGVLIDGQLVDEVGFRGKAEKNLDYFKQINSPYTHTEVIVCQGLDEFQEICKACGCTNDISMLEIEKTLKKEEWFKELTLAF